MGIQYTMYENKLLVLMASIFNKLFDIIERVWMYIKIDGFITHFDWYGLCLKNSWNSDSYIVYPLADYIWLFFFFCSLNLLLQCFSATKMGPQT